MILPIKNTVAVEKKKSRRKQNIQNNNIKFISKYEPSSLTSFRNGVLLVLAWVASMAYLSWWRASVDDVLVRVAW